MDLMEKTRPEVRPGTLNVVRLPGESGATLRCCGELTLATAEILRREVELLASVGNPVVTVSLTGCTYVDVDGVLALLDLYKRMSDLGQRVILVAAPGHILRLLHALSLDDLLPVFPGEHAAALALRGGGPADAAPGGWEEARRGSARWWRAICDAIKDHQGETVLKSVVSMHPLCHRSEEELQRSTASGSSRADYRCCRCPLFHALGGKPEDIGCRSVQDSIVRALLAGDRTTAYARAVAIVRLIEAMPMPSSNSG